MVDYRFAGYRVIEFPSESKIALQELAERLIPHESDIISSWIEFQYAAWQPPGLSRMDLEQLFRDLLRNMLHCMRERELELCITNMEETGTRLARTNFPYEALIISFHFLEESYMPFLLHPPSEKVQKWLIRMDEFLHAAIAALATSYFQFHREQMLVEAEIGRVVQEALFPHPARLMADLEIGFVYASASENARLGGDFLDVFQFGADSVAFVVGDLSGHGLEAAADSAMVRNLFKGFMHDKADLAQAVTTLNWVLSQELESHQFVTALAGLYEPSGKLTLVNAGSPMPMVLGRDQQVIYHPGLPLGIDRGAKYDSTEVEFAQGDVFLAFTDGLSEARVGGDLFGDTRIMSALREVHDASPRAIAEHLMDQATRHAKGKLLDDMAILVLKRLAERD